MSAAFPFVTYGAPVFRIKQDSTLPAIEYQTVDGSRQLVSLLGAISVDFVYRLREAATSTAVTRTATIVDAANGQVRYNWVALDTAVAGEYYGEWVVTFPSGERRFPDRSYLPFVVEAKLD